MKRTFKIIASIIALVLLLIFIFFEIKDVPDVKVGSSYEVEKKDTGGLWVFYRMLKAQYGAEQTELMISDDVDFLEDRENSLLIMVSSSFSVDTVTAESLLNFITSGNELLVISEKFYLPDHYSWELLLETSYRSDSTFQLKWADSLSYVHEHLAISDFPDILKRVSYFDDREGSSSVTFRDTLVGFENLLYLQDSLPIFRKLQLCSESMYFHSAPCLFTNEGTASKHYLQNFNKTFEEFTSENVILHKYRRTNINAGTNEDSLIKYILSQRPLKYAYYLTILMAVVYAFFASKRKQKEIEVIEQSRNTSLEYINTMSALFMAQGQNEKLVSHMRKNFFHKVKMAYFLNVDDPQFAEKLSKKSKVPIEKINSIIKQFSVVDSYTFNDDQLIRLYTDVNSFHQIRK